MSLTVFGLFLGLIRGEEWAWEYYDADLVGDWVASVPENDYWHHYVVILRCTFHMEVEPWPSRCGGAIYCNKLAEGQNHIADCWFQRGIVYQFGGAMAFFVKNLVVERICAEGCISQGGGFLAVGGHDHSNHHYFDEMAISDCQVWLGSIKHGAAIYAMFDASDSKGKCLSQLEVTNTNYTANWAPNGGAAVYWMQDRQTGGHQRWCTFYGNGGKSTIEAELGGADWAGYVFFDHCNFISNFNSEDGDLRYLSRASGHWANYYGPWEYGTTIMIFDFCWFRDQGGIYFKPGDSGAFCVRNSVIDLPLDQVGTNYWETNGTIVDPASGKAICIGQSQMRDSCTVLYFCPTEEFSASVMPSRPGSGRRCPIRQCRRRKPRN